MWGSCCHCCFSWMPWTRTGWQVTRYVKSISICSNNRVFMHSWDTIGFEEYFKKIILALFRYCISADWGLTFQFESCIGKPNKNGCMRKWSVFQWKVCDYVAIIHSRKWDLCLRLGVWSTKCDCCIYFMTLYFIVQPPPSGDLAMRKCNTAASVAYVSVVMENGARAADTSARSSVY